MARINLTELLADREAGTEGPWDLGVSMLTIVEMGGRSTVATAHHFHNAFRIARLPELEAAYIEAVRAIREMKDLLSYAGQDACNEAVAQGNKNKAWHIARKFLGDGGMTLPDHLNIDSVKVYGPIKVFLDGEEIPYAFECHQKEGWVKRYKSDEKGPILDGDEFATETVYGVVTAEIAE